MSNMKAFSSVITGVLVLGLMIQAQEIRGKPGVDYPNYDKIPKTSFSCSGQKYIPGLYADMETDCQVFHFCEENLQESFLCPPGMTFNQASLTCDFWDNFNCSLTPQFYSMNTGPEMNNARRNILMILQLKNRSRSRPSIPSADVYEKITSLYDGALGEEESESKDLAAVDVKAESEDKKSPEVASEMPGEARERSEENESHFNQDLSGIDESILDELARISEESKDEEPEIFYDPVTEKYYVDYDSSQTINEVPEEMADQVGNSNYGGFERYGLGYNEYVDEMQSDSGGQYSKERVNDLEFNDMLDMVEAREKELKTTLGIEQQPLKRVRRRPLYRVVQENDVGISSVERGVKYNIDSTDNWFTTESTSTDTEVNFEFPHISDGNEIQEKEPEFYEVPEELQYPNIASVGNSEVQVSEEFDQAVSEMVFPEVNEHGLGSYLSSEEEQGEESVENDSQAYQTTDEYSYIENTTPDDYESYSTDCDVNREVTEQEFAQETRDNEENSNWYRDEESLGSESSVESEDTYMVIPDEYDTLDQYLETNGQTETYSAQRDATDSSGAWRDFLPSYVSPAVYAPIRPYWSAPQFYYPDGYGRQVPLTNEHFFNRDSLNFPEYTDRPPNDQAYRYNFADISPERSSPLPDSGPYAYESPASFPGHMYDYSTGYVYPYANVYGNPYTGNFGYDTPDMKVETESSFINVNPEAETTANSDYSESEMQYWAQSYSTESPEIEAEVEITESALPTDEALDNIYVTSRADEELSEMSPETSDAPFDENMGEAETFYLFDFDENSEEELNSDATDEVLDSNKLDPNELFPAEEPSRLNDSLGDLEGINVGSESESTGTQTKSVLEDFVKENSKRFGRSETSENEKSIDSTFQTGDTRNDGNRVLLSASGIAGANGPQVQSPRQPRSYGSNINLQRDPKFLINKIYSESNFKHQDAVLAQPHGTEDVPLPSNMEDRLFHRTGDAGQSRVSKLSELQKRILSLKQGKLGTFKKYMNSDGNKN